MKNECENTNSTKFSYTDGIILLLLLALAIFLYDRDKNFRSDFQELKTYVYKNIPVTKTHDSPETKKDTTINNKSN